MPRSTRTIALVLLCSLGLLTCASTPNVVTQPSQSIGFDIAYYFNINNFVRAPDVSYNDFQVELEPILNSFWGSPDTKMGMSFSVGPNNSVQYDTKEFQSTLDLLLENIPPQDRHAGLQFSPQTTKYARFGTFTKGKDSAKFGAAGFVDQQTKRYLLLTYFDQACKVEGHNSIASDNFGFDLEIPRKGYYWLVIEQIGKYDFIVRQYVTDPSPTFAIQIRGQDV